MYYKATLYLCIYVNKCTSTCNYETMEMIYKIEFVNVKHISSYTAATRSILKEHFLCISHITLLKGI